MARGSHQGLGSLTLRCATLTVTLTWMRAAHHSPRRPAQGHVPLSLADSRSPKAEARATQFCVHLPGPRAAQGRSHCILKFIWRQRTPNSQHAQCWRTDVTDFRTSHKAAGTTPRARPEDRGTSTEQSREPEGASRNTPRVSDRNSDPMGPTVPVSVLQGPLAVHGQTPPGQTLLPDLTPSTEISPGWNTYCVTVRR